MHGVQVGAAVQGRAELRDAVLFAIQHHDVITCFGVTARLDIGDQACGIFDAGVYDDQFLACDIRIGREGRGVVVQGQQRFHIQRGGRGIGARLDQFRAGLRCGQIAEIGGEIPLFVGVVIGPSVSGV